MMKKTNFTLELLKVPAVKYTIIALLIMALFLFFKKHLVGVSISTSKGEDKPTSN